MISTILHSQFMHGAVSGLITAALVDYRVFLTWRSFTDAKQYNWSIAILRWLQGFVAGGLTAVGYGVIA